MTRIEAFSDGVFAIIVTLLVLDLKVPDLHRPRARASFASGSPISAPKFLSWLISFIIVCKFWLNHHYVLSFARSANYALVRLQFALFSMCQSFVPFPTAMMGAYPRNPLAVSFFGCIMLHSTRSSSWC